jgi:hypothetical protein
MGPLFEKIVKLTNLPLDWVSQDLLEVWVLKHGKFPEMESDEWNNIDQIRQLILCYLESLDADLQEHLLDLVELD